jgi:hypothetical protein
MDPHLWSNQVVYIPSFLSDRTTMNPSSNSDANAINVAPPSSHAVDIGDRDHDRSQKQIELVVEHASKTPTVPSQERHADSGLASRITWPWKRVHPERTLTPQERNSPDRISAILQNSRDVQPTTTTTQQQQPSSGPPICLATYGALGCSTWTNEMESAFHDFIRLMKCESETMELNAKQKSFLIFCLFLVIFLAPSTLLFEMVANLSSQAEFWLRLCFGVGAGGCGFVYKNFKLTQNAQNDINGSIALARMVRNTTFEMTKPVQRRRAPDVMFAELSDKRDQIKRGKLSFMLDVMNAYSSLGHDDITASSAVVAVQVPLPGVATAPSR